MKLESGYVNIDGKTGWKFTVTIGKNKLGCMFYKDMDIKEYAELMTTLTHCLESR